MRIKASMIAVAVLALVSIGSAQQGQGGGQRRQGGFGRGGAQRLTQLLRNAQVQEELKVTDDEKTKIEAIPAPTRGGGGGQRGPMSAEDQMKQFTDDKATTAGILTADQEKRLEELRIQWAGMAAVMLPDVQASLGLSDDQKTKLTTLQTQQRDAMREMAQSGGDPADMRTKMQAMTTTMNTEIEKVLTDDQKTKLKALGGTELKQVRRAPGGGARGGR